MSEIARVGSTRVKKPDERVARTRLRLVRAFNALILERGYAKMTVGDVIKQAGVVRSTFYEHFETKDDILRQSLVPVLSVLADALVEPDVSERLCDIIAHFWENRRLARTMFSGTTRALVSPFLADLIQGHLTEVVRKKRGAKPIVPARLMAAHLAEAQLGLIEAWCSGKAASTPEAVARMLYLGTNASVSEWIGRRTK
jgi:AcrR family transcriptional regulator